MKAILSFKLPEEQFEFELAQNGSAYSAAVDAFLQETVRRMIKYTDYSKFREYLSDPNNYVDAELVEAFDKGTNNELIYHMAIFFGQELRNHLETYGVNK